jgi:hypothetical protein
VRRSLVPVVVGETGDDPVEIVLVDRSAQAFHQVGRPIV